MEVKTIKAKDENIKKMAKALSNCMRVSKLKYFSDLEHFIRSYYEKNESRQVKVSTKALSMIASGSIKSVDVTTARNIFKPFGLTLDDVLEEKNG
jgi:hypothetical protein